MIEINQPKLPETLEEFATAVNKDGADLYELSKRTTNVPDYQTASETFNKNRLDASYQPKGIYQNAVKMERQALIDGIKALLNQYNNKYKTVFNENSLRFLYYIPNAKFPYFNKLFKIGLMNGLSQCDINALKTFWMSDRYKEDMLNFVTPMINKLKQGFSLQPVTAKSGIPLVCTGNKIYGNIRNPGFVEISDDMWFRDAYPKYDYEENTNWKSCKTKNSLCKCKPNDLDEIANKINSIVTQKTNESQYEGMSANDYMDKTVLNQLASLKKLINANPIDQNDLKKVINSLAANIRNSTSNSYLMGVLLPWLRSDLKIPKRIQQYSSSIQIRTTLSLTSNASGNVALVFSPFYMSPLGNASTTLGINNDVTLTGNASSNFFLGADAGQTPQVDYNEYALVSAGVSIQALGSINNTSGFMAGSIVYDENLNGNLAGSVIANAARYGNFSLIDNGYYMKQITNKSCCESQSGLYFRYIPLDDTWCQFVSTGAIKTGYSFVAYIRGAAALTTVAKLDIVLNYEALADPTITDWVGATQNNSKYSNFTEAFEEFKLYDPVTTYLPSMKDVQTSSYDTWLNKKFIEDSLLVNEFNKMPIIMEASSFENKLNEKKLITTVKKVIKDHFDSEKTLESEIEN